MILRWLKKSKKFKQRLYEKLRGLIFFNELNGWLRRFSFKWDKFPSIGSFILSQNENKELRAKEKLGVPCFMRVDEKRWCQASVLKGGRSFRSRSSLAGKTGKSQLGAKQKFNGGEINKMLTNKKILIGFTLITLIAGALIFLGTSGSASSLKGKLVIKGSDTVLPLAQAWAEAFMKKHPDVSISVSGGGSGVGIAALLDGTCDIADASRELKPEEAKKAKSMGIQIYDTKVAIDGISIIVNPKNPIKKITFSQLNDIYSGKAQSWKEFGGPDVKITAVGRDTASGTYELFREKILGEKGQYAPTVIHTPSNNAIATTVSQDVGAIGYVGVAYAEKFAKSGKVKIIAVAKDNKSTPLMPTKDNIKKGKYPLFRYLHNYTRGKPQGLIKAYLDFVLSPEGQKIVEKVGYIPLK